MLLRKLFKVDSAVHTNKDKDFEKAIICLEAAIKQYQPEAPDLKIRREDLNTYNIGVTTEYIFAKTKIQDFLEKEKIQFHIKGDTIYINGSSTEDSINICTILTARLFNLISKKNESSNRFNISSSATQCTTSFFNSNNNNNDSDNTHHYQYFVLKIYEHNDAITLLEPNDILFSDQTDAIRYYSQSQNHNHKLNAALLLSISIHDEQFNQAILNNKEKAGPILTGQAKGESYQGFLKNGNCKAVIVNSFQQPFHSMRTIETYTPFQQYQKLKDMLKNKMQTIKQNAKNYTPDILEIYLEFNSNLESILAHLDTTINKLSLMVNLLNEANQKLLDASDGNTNFFGSTLSKSEQKENSNMSSEHDKDQDALLGPFLHSIRS